MNGRISNDDLRRICIENDWFTAGSSSQYEKLFYMNDMKAPISEMATVIWLCSDGVDRRDIIFTLDHAGFTERWTKSEYEHLQDWLCI